MKRALLFTAAFLTLIGSSHAYDAYCGNKTVDPVEQCDDGNFINRDGCSAYCQLEDMTPPSVVKFSYANGSTGIPTTTRTFTILFNEPLGESSVISSNVYLENNAKPFEATLSLDSDKKLITLTTQQDLFPNQRHAFHIKNIKDTVGNFITDEVISVFDTGDYIDIVPPTVAPNPPGGLFQYTQQVELKAYLDSYTGSDEFLDETAVIYYTIDGSNPTTGSPKYTSPLIIKENTSLRYFSVDAKGNASPIEVQVYNFGCGQTANATKLSAYPVCSILECKPGFIIQGGICVQNAEAAAADILLNSVTAPLFSSSTPVTVASKPAILMTKQHRGIIPRPVNFKDIKLGTNLLFERDTLIVDENGKPFEGLIKRPVTLYSKNFPINFGFVFKSILEFAPSDTVVTFSPPYRLTLPYNDLFDPNEEVTVFTYDRATETYTQYPLEKVIKEPSKKQVTIISDKSNIFFVAQNGKGFNKSVFEDMEGHWAGNYVEALYRKGIVKGRGPKIFAPNEILTRAEFIKVALASIEAKIPDADAIAHPPFEDVPLYSWYAPYVSVAKEIGLTQGYPDGTFRPDQPINRAEAIKILMAAFEFTLEDATSEAVKPYKDILSDQWYFPAVNFAIKYRLLDGLRKENDFVLPDWFGPAEPILRGEMAKLAIKSMELKEELSKAKKK